MVEVDRAVFAAQLRDWRRAARIKQHALAHYLGVTQGAISRWESGHDAPGPATLKRLQDAMTGAMRDDLAIERMAMLGQSSIRAIYDVDGIRLRALSAGFSALWPNFSQLEGVSFADNLVGESAELVHTPDFMRSLKRRDIAFVSGVSDMHVDFMEDAYLRHRWHMVCRAVGPRTYVEMLYEPCDPATPTGVEKLATVDDVVLWTLEAAEKGT